VSGGAGGGAGGGGSVRGGPGGSRRAASPRERLLFGDADVVVPRDADELCDIVREAEAQGRRLRPAGLGEHTEAGDGAATPVSLAAFDDVVQYEPDDFTIGVGAGMPLARLRERLAQHGQELPVDFGAAGSGTVGGLIARAPLYPRQSLHGPISALLLGAEGVRGGGLAFRSGGMVVKNVSGYQHHKLLVGAMGRLGFVTRVNLRLRPRPDTRALRFAAAADASDADRRVTELRSRGTEPVVFVLGGSATGELRKMGVPAPDADRVVAGLFEGAAPRVAWQRGDGGPGEGPDAAAAFLDAVADLCEPAGVPGNEGVVRVSVLPTRALAAADDARAAIESAGCIAASVTNPGTGAVHLRWHGGDLAAPIDELTRIAQREQGVARLLWLPPDVRADRPRLLTGDPNPDLTRRLLSVFDRAGILAPSAGGGAP
jgi:glycolate oxidase FAD binding subunit